jgi:hypothetical protein
VGGLFSATRSNEKPSQVAGDLAAGGIQLGNNQRMPWLLNLRQSLRDFLRSLKIASLYSNGHNV